MSWPLATGDLGGWEDPEAVVDSPPVQYVIPPAKGTYFDPRALGQAGDVIASTSRTFHTSTAVVRHVRSAVEATLTRPEVFGVVLLDSFVALFGSPCSLELTVYDDDRATILWKAGTSPDHDQPYLVEPDDYGSQEVDFAAGAATLGTVTVTVVDVAQSIGDQESGYVTGKLSRVGIPDLAGHRCRLVRFISEALGGVVVADGPAGTPTMDQSYAAFSWPIRDTRDAERKIKAFMTAEGLLMPPSRPGGTGLNYNREPYGYDPVTDTWLNYAMPPLVGIFTRGGPLGMDPTQSGSIALDGNPIDNVVLPDVNVDFFEYVAGRVRDLIVEPGGTSWTTPPQQASRIQGTEGVAGIIAFRNHSDAPPEGREEDILTVLWRDNVTKGDWHEIGRTWGIRYFAHNPIPTFPNLILAGEESEDEGYFLVHTFYFGDLSEIPDIPEDGQEIELLVMARGPANKLHPFTLEGVTAGQFAKNVYDGVYSPRDANGELVPSQVRYDAAALLQMTDTVRMRLTEPVDDARDWLESHIYAPLGWAPALDNDGRVSPVSQVPPANTDGLAAITNENAEPAPSWNAGDRIINVLRLTYERDYPPLTEEEFETGDGLASKTVILEYVDEVSVGRFGRQVLELDGSAFRAIGRYPTGDPTVDTAHEMAYQLGTLRQRHIQNRYSLGAPSFELAVMRSAIPDVRAGSWVIVNLSWLPDYITRRRGLLCLGQVTSIGDLDCAWRKLLIEQVVPVDFSLS